MVETCGEARTGNHPRACSSNGLLCFKKELKRSSGISGDKQVGYESGKLNVSKSELHLYEIGLKNIQSRNSR